MSVQTATLMANDWPPHRNRSQSSVGFDGGRCETLGFGFNRIQTSTLEVRPPLRSHRSFPYSLGSSNQSSTHYQSPLSQVAANPSIPEDSQPLSVDRHEGSEAAADVKLESADGGSAPTSPLLSLTPISPELDQEQEQEQEQEEDDQLEDEYDLQNTGEELDEEVEVPKTAAERRAEKRKMKRFRLNHNQTRFLMSEFARQAHPDASQRERLSREIPGLSSRQVQVWFQNRRAKLKRLTTDDRERMMKSRALPEDFDTTQALHSPFGSGMPQSFSNLAYSTPLASPSSFASTFHDNGTIRSLVGNDLRRSSDDDSTISPVSNASNFGSFYTPPGSRPGSETMSPISPIGERASFMNQPYSQTSPRTTIPFVRSSSFSANMHSHSYPHIPRLQLHERVSRTRADSLGSPLRSSMSYTSTVNDYSASPPSDVMSSHAESNEQTRSYSLGTTNASQQSGFSQIAPLGFQSSALSRPRPTITTFPPGLDLKPQYRSLLPFSNSSQGFQSAPLAIPQDFRFHATTTQTTFSVGFGDPESYYKSEPYQHRIFEDTVSDDYSPVAAIEQSQLDESTIEDISGDSLSLQPEFKAGRRRSFTLPNDYSRAQ